MWYIYKTNIIQPKKRKEILTYVTTCMNLEGKKVKKVVENDNYYIISLSYGI